MQDLPWWRILVQLAVVSIASISAVAGRLPTLRIVAACIGTMILYGILQDQVTVRLCPAYFRIAHQPIPGLTDPTLLGITWGFLGSWWGGLFFGLALAATARAGTNPPLTSGDLLGPLIALLCVVALGSLSCGLTGAYTATVLQLSLGGPWDQLIAKRERFWIIVVASTHFGSYLWASLAAVGVCLWAAKKRSALAERSRPGR